MRRTRQIPIQSNTKSALVVDGQTEYWYFQMLKRNEKIIPINIEPKLPQKKKLSEQFKLVNALAKDYDKVFWVVDYDAIVAETRQRKTGQKTAKQELKQYCQKLQGHSIISIIVNNPCLEFWFLIHFEYTTRVFPDCSKVTHRLKSHLPHYEKTEKFFLRRNQDIYLQLKPKLKTAIENSRKAGKFDPQNLIGISEMQLFFAELEDQLRSQEPMPDIDG